MRSTPHVARRHWAQAIPGLIVVAVFATLLGLSWERERHLIFRPAAITHTQLRAAQSPDQLPSPFITLEIERQLETGVRLERQVYAVKRIECDYVAIPVADKWIIAEVPAGLKGNQLTGYVAPWTGGVQAEALGMIREKLDPQSLDKLLPFQLEAGHDLQTESRLMLSIGAGMIAVGLLWAGVALRTHPALPGSFAAYRQFAHAGSWPGRRMPAR